MNEESIDKNRKNIKLLLKAEKVKLIAYVDDKFDSSSYKDDFWGGMKSVLVANKLDELNFDSLPSEWPTHDGQLDKKLLEVWDDFNEEQRLSCMAALQKLNDDELSNILPLVELQKLNTEEAELLKTYDLNNWNAEKEALFSSLEGSEKILCIFDKNLEDTRTTGVSLTIDTLTNYKEKSICGIFSNEFSIDDEDSQRDALEKKEDMGGWFYPISKHRLDGDNPLGGFVDGVKNILLVPHVDSLKTQCLKTIKAAAKKAKASLKDLSPKSYNKIIQEMAEAESSWEPSELLRVYNVYFGNEYMKEFINEDRRSDFQTELKKSRALNIATEYTAPVSDELNGLREMELTESESFLCNLNRGLCNGDVFKIKNKKYILLMQGCNILMRKGGKRNRGLNEAALVELKQKTDSEAGKNDVLLGRHKYVINYENSLFCSLNILDLVVFSDDGVAKINLSSTCNNSLLEMWKKRYGHLKRFYTDQSKIIEEFQELDSPSRLFKGSIYRPDCLKKIKISGEDCYSKENTTFEFPVKRVLRIKDPLAQDLLRKFNQHLSRVAFDMDYTK